MLLVYLSCAWVAGIWLGSAFHLPLLLSPAGLVPLLLLFTRRHRRAVVLGSLALFTFLAAAAYAYPSLHASDAGRLRYYNDGGVVAVRGTVAAGPDVRDSSTRLELAAAEIRVDGDWRDVKGKALLVVPRYPAYGYGDRLLATGELATPPYLGDFDYRGYLAHQGIYATMLYPRLEVLDAGHSALAGLYALRGRLAESLARVLPEPQAALAQGMVLGIRGNIPAPLKDDFALSGTSHLLAISGLHLGIMAGILLSLGLWLFGRRRYLYVWLTLAAVWGYVLITGMHPPVLRAAIMASVFLAAELLGRQRSAIVALTLAAAVMVGVHPYILGDASFQLSFLAMAGLVFLFPAFRDLGRRAVTTLLGEEGTGAAAAGFAVDALSATLAAVIAVWPVVAYYFGMVSLVGPLATFLALPALPGIIVAGALAAVLGLVALPLAQAFGWLAWFFLAYTVTVVRGLAAPAAAVAAGGVSPAFVAGYYLVLAAAIWLYRRRQRLMTTGALSPGGVPAGLSPLKWAVPPLLVVAVMVTYTAATMPDDKLRVSFLDVGQGDATLIQKGSMQVLVDGGPSPQALELALGRSLPFWDRTIDLVVLTHPHEDHLAGLVEVLRRYRVGQVLAPSLDSTSPLYGEWRGLLESNGIKLTEAVAGQRLDLGDGVTMTVLQPLAAPLEGTASDTDNNAVVLRLDDGEVSFLLTTDIQYEAEWELMRRRAGLPAAVLKVAHHGSVTSTTPGFLAAAGPRVAVISVGAANRYGHPDEDVLVRLEAGVDYLYRTDEDGTVEFITDGERLWVDMGR